MQNIDNATYKYAAFISYNYKDISWGKKLHLKLERYKLSSTLSNKNGVCKTPIKPVFFAPYEIQPNELSEELKSRLRASKNLIVICSPNSAESEYVGFEIEYFYQLGRKNNIYFFIVDGTPNSNDESECYNPKIKELGLDGYLGVNVKEKIYNFSYLNHERAYIQLITKILGIEFDDVWQRHKRLMLEKLLSLSFIILAFISVLFYVWNNNRVVDVNIELNETSYKNDALPQLSNAKIKLCLPNDTIIKTISDINSSAIFPNIPNKYMGQEVCLYFYDSIALYNNIDTTLLLNKNILIDVCRNEKLYGVVKFQLYNPNTNKYVHSCRVSINGESTITDEEGRGVINIPLHKQNTIYSISSDIELEDTSCCGMYDSDGIIIYSK